VTKSHTIDREFQRQIDEILLGLCHLKTAFVYDSLSSTNDHAHLLEQEQATSGTLVLASRQTQGRGRLNRSWLMAEGDIALSIIMRPPFIPRNWALLSMLPAITMVEALANLSICVRLKWPNDLIIPGDDPKVPLSYLGNYRKVGGILIENVFRNNQMAASIVGVGLNITANPKLYEQVPHASSLQILDPAIDRLAVLRQFLTCFDQKLMCLNNPDFEQSILSDYTNNCETLGRFVVVNHADKTISGQAVAIKPDGSLVLQDGTFQHIILAGDVTGT
jgi:BirA family transcriptional regulator, biotin operon repressor / biotin---[acetyl-CoA-carboxylase] ligase